MRALRVIGRFCYDFVIGDDWKIAAAVVTALALTSTLLLTAALAGAALVVVGAVLLLSAFAVSVVVDVLRSG